MIDMPARSNQYVKYIISIVHVFILVLTMIVGRRMKPYKTKRSTIAAAIIDTDLVVWPEFIQKYNVERLDPYD